MTDDQLDLALREALLEERIRPELADRLLRSERPRRGGVWMGLAAGLAAAATLVLAALPSEGPTSHAGGGAAPPPDAALATAIRPDDLAACYDALLEREPGASVRLELAIGIEGGQTRSVRPSEPADPDFSACVVEAVEGWSWPDSGATSLVLPVVFEPPPGPVQLRVRVVALDEAALEALSGPLRAHPGQWTRLASAPTLPPTAVLLAAPTLVTPWGEPAELAFGEEGDLVRLSLLPRASEDSSLLDARLDLAGRDGSEQELALEPGPQHLGVLQQGRAGWLLVLVEL